MTIEITRMDLDAGGLRTAAARSEDVAAARRMPALALVLEGQVRAESARAAGMDRQTLRDWVHRYNASGLAGLTNRRNPGGAPRKLTAEQEMSVAEWVRAGPTLEEHKVVRWRCCDLRDEIARRFGVEMHERTVGKLLARLSFSRVSVRPRHPEQNVEAQEAHKKFPDYAPCSAENFGTKREQMSCLSRGWRWDTIWCQRRYKMGPATGLKTGQLVQTKSLVLRLGVIGGGEAAVAERKPISRRR